LEFVAAATASTAARALRHTAVSSSFPASWPRAMTFAAAAAALVANGLAFNGELFE
jgi:hypothetical protein